MVQLPIAAIGKGSAHEHVLPGRMSQCHIMCHSTTDPCLLVRLLAGVADMLGDVFSSMRDAARGISSNRSGSLLPSVTSQHGRGLLLVGRHGVGACTGEPRGITVCWIPRHTLACDDTPMLYAFFVTAKHPGCLLGCTLPPRVFGCCCMYSESACAGVPCRQDDTAA